MPQPTLGGSSTTTLSGVFEELESVLVRAGGDSPLGLSAKSWKHPGVLSSLLPPPPPPPPRPGIRGTWQAGQDRTVGSLNFPGRGWAMASYLHACRQVFCSVALQEEARPACAQQRGESNASKRTEGLAPSHRGGCRGPRSRWWDGEAGRRADGAGVCVAHRHRSGATWFFLVLTRGVRRHPAGVVCCVANSTTGQARELRAEGQWSDDGTAAQRTVPLLGTAGG